LRRNNNFKVFMIRNIAEVDDPAGIGIGVNIRLGAWGKGEQ
jgi:hypothetical protein